MIDFENAEYLKLRPVKDNAFEDLIRPMFIGGEEIIQCFQTVRDGVVFTNRRIFAINIQGLVGKKKDFTILPYSRIQAFSVETAGVLDLDSPLPGRFTEEDLAGLLPIARLLEEACL